MVEQAVEARLLTEAGPEPSGYVAQDERRLRFQELYLEEVARVEQPALRYHLWQQADDWRKRLLKRKQERDSVLEVVNRETLEECVAQLKRGQVLECFGLTYLSIWRSIAIHSDSPMYIWNYLQNDPRVARLLGIAKEGTPTERTILSRAIREDLFRNGLCVNPEGGEAECDLVNTTDPALPHIIAALDIEGETLPLLVGMAEVYSQQGFIAYEADTMQTGRANSCSFSRALAMAMEEVLTHLLAHTRKPAASISPSLAEYARARMGNASGLTGLVMLSARLLGQDFSPATITAKSVANPFRSPVLPILEPEWYDPSWNSHDWMVLAWGGRILRELEAAGATKDWEQVEVTAYGS